MSRAGELRRAKALGEGENDTTFPPLLVSSGWLFLISSISERRMH